MSRENDSLVKPADKANATTLSHSPVILQNVSRSHKLVPTLPEKLDSRIRLIDPYAKFILYINFVRKLRALLIDRQKVRQTDRKRPKEQKTVPGEW